MNRVGQGAQSYGGSSRRTYPDKAAAKAGDAERRRRKGMKGQPQSLQTYFKRHLGFVLQSHTGSVHGGFGKGGLAHLFSFPLNGKIVKIVGAKGMAEYLLESDTRLPAVVQESSKGSVSREKMVEKIKRVIQLELAKNGFGLYKQGKKRRARPSRSKITQEMVAGTSVGPPPAVTSRQALLAEAKQAGAKKLTLTDGTIVEF